MQWASYEWHWQNLHSHSALGRVGCVICQMFMRHSPLKKNKRDSLIMSSLRFKPESVQLLNVHLWGFLRISNHMSFQHHGPKNKENMAWERWDVPFLAFFKSRVSATSFLPSISTYIIGQYNKLLYLGMHLNIYSFKLLWLSFPIFKFSRWGIWYADIQLRDQGNMHSGRVKKSLMDIRYGALHCSLNPNIGITSL